MARSKEASFETLAEFLKNFASEPLTAKQIIQNMKLMKDATGLYLSQPTIYRLLEDKHATERAMHGIGTHRGEPKRYMYTESAKKAAARTIRENVHLALKDEAEIRASATAKFAQNVLESNLTPDALSAMVERKKQLEDEILKLQYAKADFITDAFEEELILGFRAAREKYDNEENLDTTWQQEIPVSAIVKAHEAYESREDYNEVMLLTMAAMLARNKGDRKIL